jgi:hypothetical protein
MDNAIPEAYKQIRQEIHYEHSQISNRMQWFTASQAFLAAAWALLAKTLLEKVSSGFLAARWFLAIVPTLGIVLSVTILVSLSAAIAKIKWLRNTREIKHAESDYYTGSLLAHNEMSRLLQRFCRQDAVDKCGTLYPRVVPWAFLLFWVILLCVGSVGF